MLNLTTSPITLLAPSGATTTIETSGYVARVETIRAKADEFSWYCRDGYPCYRIPVIEESPAAIVVDLRGEAWPLDASIIDAAAFSYHGDQGIERVGRLLVAESVARAAHALEHPLASHMVWAIEGTQLEPAPRPYAYRALQRMPQ